VRWQDHPISSRLYHTALYLCAIPSAVFCLTEKNDYPPLWLLLTLLSAFVATINIRLPNLSTMLSMGDVFTIIILTKFGPGAALINYWIALLAMNVSNAVRRRGSYPGIRVYRWAFNLASAALATLIMQILNQGVNRLSIPYPGSLILSVFAIALGWFFVNTGTMSLAIALSKGRSFLAGWRDGLLVHFLNFMGSAAVAGLISFFYESAGFVIFLLCLPIAIVLYQLYRFSIQKHEQAQEHIAQLNRLYLQTVDSLAGAVDAKDRYTHGHIRRVQAYAVELAKLMGMSDENQLRGMQAGALLHDIGKIAIPEYILNKPTVLTETEFEKMKIHPVVGANMLKTIDFPYPVIPLVRSHHERWDGMGYPEGLSGEQIPFGARVLSLVDCYDALTTNRPYRAPMARTDVIALFKREAGKAYDPTIVETFINNIEAMEAAGKNVKVDDTDLWGIQESENVARSNGRSLEKVQPTVTYGKALNGSVEIQRELYSVFEFTRAEIRCLSSKDILTFMGLKLSNLIAFDAAVFYTADLEDQSVTASHVIGHEIEGLAGLRIGLEQKLSGWVAANNQSLCNLPPFPDFLNCKEPKPTFQISAIAPINRDGIVFGAVALYRKTNDKFDEESFRRLEIIAAQTAVALSKQASDADENSPLTDSATGLANGFQLYLMFDKIAMDAHRYEYPLAVFSIHLDDLKAIRNRWGHISRDECLRAVAKHLSGTLRETDLLVRYGYDEFVALNPRMDREQAEALKSRLQNELDHLRFAVRADEHFSIPASIGIASFPEDGLNIEALLAVAEWRVREDRELRAAVKSSVKRVVCTS
jgi:diguanylate cyclase (GGDEF)-like protein/putative nucleotidyltransferase with HDIG domain